MRFGVQRAEADHADLSRTARANIRKRVGKRDLIGTSLAADRLRNTIRRGTENVYDILFLIRRETPTTARRKVHVLNSRLRLNTRCDVLATCIYNGDTPVSSVREVKRVGELRESDRRDWTSLEIFNFGEF